MIRCRSLPVRATPQSLCAPWTPASQHPRARSHQPTASSSGGSSEVAAGDEPSSSSCANAAPNRRVVVVLACAFAGGWFWGCPCPSLPSLPSARGRAKDVPVDVLWTSPFCRARSCLFLSRSLARLSSRIPLCSSQSWTRIEPSGSSSQRPAATNSVRTLSTGTSLGLSCGQRMLITAGDKTPRVFIPDEYARPFTYIRNPR